MQAKKNYSVQEGMMLGDEFRSAGTVDHCKTIFLELCSIAKDTERFAIPRTNQQVVEDLVRWLRPAPGSVQDISVRHARIELEYNS